MKSSTIYLNGKPLFVLSNAFSTSEVTERICRLTKLLPSEFYLTHNGRRIGKNSEQCDFGNIHVHLRIFGGKGGFGSMLRAIGAQIEKTTNREACRDLSGRRLRDINEEKRLKAWMDKQKDREAEAKERKKKKLEKLMAVPKHEFKDSAYENQRSELTEKLSNSVEEGFKQAASSAENAAKRKAIESASGPSKPKKAALWIDDDIGSSSDTDSESDSDMEKSILRKDNNSTDSNEATAEENTVVSKASNQKDEASTSSSTSKSAIKESETDTKIPADQNLDKIDSKNIST